MSFQKQQAPIIQLQFRPTLSNYGKFGMLFHHSGLNAIHLLTRVLRRPILRVDLEDFTGNRVYAEYR